jgi:hypothetical protein
MAPRQLSADGNKLNAHTPLSVPTVAARLAFARRSGQRRPDAGLAALIAPLMDICRTEASLRRGIAVPAAPATGQEILWRYGWCGHPGAGTRL